MAESDRIYTMLDRIEAKLDRVGERLAVVEAKAHKPEECPGVRRVEASLADHIEDERAEKKEAFWRGWGKEVLKLLAAAAAGFAGSKG